jgi:GH24 family phage-related lysozyme (muramidase)
MQINDAGLALVKEREGYLLALPDGRCTTYYCPAGKLTIGWGCTEGIRPGDIWTKEQAEAALRRELAKHEAAVMRLVSVNLNENQFSALVSFSYNVGSGNLQKSTLLKKLNKGDYPGAQREFVNWNKATVDGKLVELRGLSIRRAQEATLFATPTADEDAARGAPVPMAQAVVAPAVPVSGATKAIAAAAGGGAVAKGGEALITAPPPAVTDTVANVDNWSKIGKAATTMADGLWKSPVFAASLFIVAIAVIWGPSAWRKMTT